MMKRILVILTALCLVCSFALAEEMSAPATVSAVGSAALEGSTQAVLSCELNTFGPTVAEAQALMQGQLDTLRDVLKQQGVEAKDIASTRYDVHGKYDYHYTKLTETEVLSGYDVTVTLQARVADAHDLGTIIDAINGAGVNCSYDLQYETVYASDAGDDALILAAEEAMRKAGLLAEAGRVKLDQLISLEESTQAGVAVVTATYTVK